MVIRCVCPGSQSGTTLDTSAGGDSSGTTGGATGGGAAEDGCACSSDSQVPGLSVLWILIPALLRRRRMAVLAGGVAISMSSCGNDDVSGVTSTAEATSAGESSGSSSTGGQTQGWPDAWRGAFYETLGVTPGVPRVSGLWDAFYNVDVGSDLLQVEYFLSTGEDMGTRSYSLVPSGETQTLLPEADSGGFDWPLRPDIVDGAIRPGPDCSELLVDFKLEDGSSQVHSWRRGRLCLIDPFDPDVNALDEVTVDICKSAIVDCSVSDG